MTLSSVFQTPQAPGLHAHEERPCYVPVPRETVLRLLFKIHPMTGMKPEGSFVSAFLVRTLKRGAVFLFCLAKGKLCF